MLTRVPPMLVRPTRSVTAPVFARFSSQRANVHNLGAAVPLYIPPTKSLPSWWSSPRIRARLALRRWGNSGLMWYNSGRTKKELGTLDYVDYRRRAIETFVQVHYDFMNNGKATPNVSLMVVEALRVRRQGLPKNTKWELVEFTRPPKLVNYIPLPGASGAIELLQVVYRFDTKQKLTIDGTEHISTTTDYFVYLIDPIEDEVVLAGSLFESGINDKVTPDIDPEEDARAVIGRMKLRADIFRRQ